MIFLAMKGRRVYQPMGFTVAATPAQDENSAVGLAGETGTPVRRAESVVWEWMQELHDWIDLETGDALSGFEPTEGLSRLVHAIPHPAT
jgi:hypothetical protein